jgi:conjugative transfer signal peptidase TraF
MTMTGLFSRIRNTRPAPVKRLALIAGAVLIGTFQLCGLAGLRINSSPSLPVGVYMTSSKPEANLVEFCPAEPFASLAISRGYRDAGACRDGATPLLKPVVARAGDVVEVSGQGIAVNGLLLPNTAAQRTPTAAPCPAGVSAGMSSRPIWCGSLRLTKPAASTVATSVRSRSAQFEIASGPC